MPKIHDTNTGHLEEMFKAKKTLKPEEIQSRFPKASHSAMVWYLRYKRGMKIEVKKDGVKTIKYTYDPSITVPIINGSKKIYDEQMNSE